MTATIPHTPFQYVGGKWEMADWIASHLPAGDTLVITHSRRGMASSVSRWQRLPETVLAIADRLADVQIEARDAVELIKETDRPGTTYYIDPPYMASERSGELYAHEAGDDHHAKLLEVLCNLQGRAVVSGYAHPAYDEALAGWERHEREVKCRSNVNGKPHGKGARPTRREILWVKQS